jgi:hypothetical protein
MIHQLMCLLGFHQGKWSELKTDYYQKTNVIELQGSDYEIGPRRIYAVRYQEIYCSHCGNYKRKVFGQDLLETIPRPMGGYDEPPGRKVAWTK